jgi:hypothetical protein
LDNIENGMTGAKNTKTSLTPQPGALLEGGKQFHTNPCPEHSRLAIYNKWTARIYSEQSA